MFPAGMTEVAISIAITSDDVFEGNENFTLTIDSALLPSYVTIGNPGEATVTILDDDRKKLCILNIRMNIMFSIMIFNVNNASIV